MKCECCKKEKTSTKKSKLTNSFLCGTCRIDEYFEMRGEAIADQYVRQGTLL